MSGDDIKGKVRRMGDSPALQMISRWASIIGIPISIFILTQALLEFRLLRDDIRVVREQQAEQNVVITKIVATLDEGYGPRIIRLEATQQDILRNLNSRAKEQFTKTDALEMRGQLERQIDQRIERVDHGS